MNPNSKIYVPKRVHPATDVIERLAKGICRNQQGCHVHDTAAHRGLNEFHILTVTCDPADAGGVLGKQRRTFNALEVIVRAIAKAQEIEAELVFESPRFAKGQKILNAPSKGFDPEEPRKLAVDVCSLVFAHSFCSSVITTGSTVVVEIFPEPEEDICPKFAEALDIVLFIWGRVSYNFRINLGIAGKQHGNLPQAK